ncbi:MAG: DUF2807 domain-containing protein [Crocinitomicaceae bacterium]
MAGKIKYIIAVGVLLAFFGCKKKEDRKCWKGHGEETFIEIPLDSVRSFDLGKGIRYKIYQDDLNKVVIRGGANMVNLIEVEDRQDTLYIDNNNSCNFLRDHERDVVVEIHYPYLQDFYIEPSDSVTFENTVSGDFLKIEIREAGGSLKLNTDVGFLYMVVSHGSGDFTVSGKATSAQLKVQHNGYGDARNFKADQLLVYQNSTAPIKINADNTKLEVEIQGIGDVFYTGTPIEVSLAGNGSGELIKM